MEKMTSYEELDYYWRKYNQACDILNSYHNRQIPTSELTSDDNDILREANRDYDFYKAKIAYMEVNST